MFIGAKIKIIAFSFFGFILLIIFSFSTKEEITYQKKSKHFQKYAAKFQRTTQSLDSVASSFKLGEVPIDSVRNEVQKTRLAYKKIEAYLAFYYPEYTNSHFNGAPLLHIERTNTLPEILPPEGLQILDELVYSSEFQQERTKISALATKLRYYYEMLYPSLQAKGMEADVEVASLRLQLVRIYTLGITGFDTPGSLNAIEEAKVSFRAMYDFLEESAPVKKNENIAIALQLFQKAVTYLEKATSFEDFDRLEFLTDYVDPLYKILGKLPSSVNAEWLEQVTSWNPKSTSLFAENFLDPYYFTELGRKEDSKPLRELGEKLFYDERLSGGQKTSCASCHNPKKAFTDGRSKSLSNLQGKTVLRNAPSLINAVYADRYFYDLRAFTLEQQAEHVIFNEDEFDTAYREILQKLTEDKTYVKSFQQVFGNEKITRNQFSKALSAYVLSLRSFNSPFDRYVRGETSSINKKAKKGFNLFMGKADCATCHFPPTFAGLVPPLYSESESEILGVIENPTAEKPRVDADKGRLANKIVSEEAWIYEKSFKTTTVRNAELTAPYFHNGAYKSLAEVIEFYNLGGGEGQGLSVRNQTLSGEPLELSEQEKEELIAFINSLTDASFIP